MSRRPQPAKTSTTLDRNVVIFVGSVVLLFAVLFFGIATRVSLEQDNDIVSRAGISVVLTGGFSDFRDTFLLIVLACGAYIAALWALNRGFRHSFAAAIAGIAVACCSMLPAMPLTSPDAVHLAADVRTFWIHHKWPAEFSGVPGKIDDPVADEVRVFRDQPSGYGPLAYALGGAPLPFVGDGFKANLVGQKVMGGIFLTLTAAAAGLLARRLGQNGGLVAGIVGLNPMMLWQYPGDGHNDAMMAFFGVLALALVMERSWPRRGSGVLAWLASALCKYAFVLASPVVAAWWWPRWRNALAFLTAAAAGFILMTYAVGVGPVQNGALGPAGAVIETSPWHWFQVWFDTGRTGDNRIALAGFVLYLFVLPLVMMFHPLKTQLDLVRAIALAMTLFLYLCTPGYHPWYIIWFLPFAAMSNSRWLIVGAIAFSIGAFLPVLALNWRITLRTDANLDHAVVWATALMWFGTAAAAYVGWRGRNWATFGGAKAKKTAGPKFAPRQRKQRAEA